MVPEVRANRAACSITEPREDAGCELQRSKAAGLGQGPRRSPVTIADRTLRVKPDHRGIKEDRKRRGE